MAAPTPLSASLRRACLLTLVVSGCVSYGSAHDLGRVLAPADPEAVVELSGPMAQLLPPEVLRAVVRAETQQLESIKGFRLAVLMLLSTAATVVFLSAFRLLRPAGVPRQGARQILSLGLLLAAIARTVEGAQAASVAQRMAQAMLRAGGALKLPWAEEADSAVITMVASSAAFSLCVVGGLLALRSHFESAAVKQQLEKLDRELPSEPTG